MITANIKDAKKSFTKKLTISHIGGKKEEGDRGRDGNWSWKMTRRKLILATGEQRQQIEWNRGG